MLKIDIIKFEAQDVVTASYPEFTGPCGCIDECMSYLPQGSHAPSCNCTDKNGQFHGPFNAAP